LIGIATGEECSVPSQNNTSGSLDAECKLQRSDVVPAAVGHLPFIALFLDFIIRRTL
jgi:hypothetical protein